MLLCFDQPRLSTDRHPKISHHCYLGLEKFQEVGGIKSPWLPEGAEIRLITTKHTCLVLVALKLELDILKCNYQQKYIVGNFYMHVIGVTLGFLLHGLGALPL